MTNSTCDINTNQSSNTSSNKTNTSNNSSSNTNDINIIYTSSNNTSSNNTTSSSANTCPTSNTNNSDMTNTSSTNASGNNTSLTEKDIALDLLTSSKATVTSIAKTLTETTNPQLRETLRNQLTACVNSHYRLSDIAINKGWYNAYAEPEQQLQQDISSARNMIQ